VLANFKEKNHGELVVKELQMERKKQEQRSNGEHLWDFK